MQLEIFENLMRMDENYYNLLIKLSLGFNHNLCKIRQCLDVFYKCMCKCKSINLKKEIVNNYKIK